MSANSEEEKKLEKFLKDKKNRINKINETIKTLTEERLAQEQEYKFFSKMLSSSSNHTESESMSLVSLDQEEEAQRRELEEGINEDVGKINNGIHENNSDISTSTSLENFLPASGRLSTETFIIERHNTTSESDNNNDVYELSESGETSTVLCTDDEDDSVSINSTQTTQYPENNTEPVTITNVTKNKNKSQSVTSSVYNCERYFDSLKSTPSSSAKSQNSSSNNNNNSLNDDISFTSSSSPSLQSPNLSKTSSRRKQSLIPRDTYVLQQASSSSSSTTTTCHSDNSRIFGAPASSTNQKMKLKNQIDVNQIFSSSLQPQGNSSKVVWNSPKAQAEFLVLRLKNKLEEKVGDDEESEPEKMPKPKDRKSASPTTPPPTKRSRKDSNDSDEDDDDSDEDDNEDDSSPVNEEEDENIELSKSEGKEYKFNEDDYKIQNLQVLEIDISERIEMAIRKNRELNLNDLDESPVSCREQIGNECFFLHKICVSASVCTKKARGMIHKRQATTSLRECVVNSIKKCSTNHAQTVTNGKDATDFTHLARDLFLVGPTWAFFSMHCRTKVRQFINNYNYLWSACKMVSSFETLAHHRGIASIVWKKFERWMYCVMSDVGIKREIETQTGSQDVRKAGYSSTMSQEELAGSEYKILGKIGNRPRYPLCSVCGVKLGAKSLRKHEKDIHNVYHYNCKKCPLFFRSPALLKSHVKEHKEFDELEYDQLPSSAQGIQSSHQFVVYTMTVEEKKKQLEEEKKRKEEKKKRMEEKKKRMEEEKKQTEEKKKRMEEKKKRMEEQKKQMEEHKKRMEEKKKQMKEEKERQKEEKKKQKEEEKERQNATRKVSYFNPADLKPMKGRMVNGIWQ